MNERLVSVLTTIQEPTRCVRELVERLGTVGAELFVAGDKKGPAKFEAARTRFLPLSEQMELPYKLARLLPTGHYVRKNLAYLVALAERPQCVYETDDDNMPNEAWSPRSITCKAQKVQAKEGRRWFNVYRLFSSELIWPRGLPLD